MVRLLHAYASTLWKDSLGHGLGERKTSAVARVVCGISCSVHRVLQRKPWFSIDRFKEGIRGTDLCWRLHRV